MNHGQHSRDLETRNGRVLRRNRRHIRAAEYEKKTVRCECDSPNTPTVCDSPETPSVCDSRKVRFEDENRKTQPTVHNYRQKLSVWEANNDVSLLVNRSPAVMDRDGQYNRRTGRVFAFPDTNFVKALLAMLSALRLVAGSKHAPRAFGSATWQAKQTKMKTLRPT